MRVFIPLFLFAFLALQCSSQATSKTRQMQEFADSVDSVDLGGYIAGGRPSYYFGTPPPPSPWEHFVAFAKGLTMPEIEVYLKDPNPKVRGLALLAIYQLEDQKAVLRYADFLNDNAIFLKKRPRKALSDYEMASSIGPNRDALTQKDLLVSDIARRMLEVYMSQTNYVYFKEQLPTFIQERQGLDYTLGFFKLLIIKTLGRMKDSNSWEKDSTMIALKNRIEHLPNKLDAAIYKLMLPIHDKGLFNDVERLEALQVLGKEHAVEILEGMPPTKDPDLYRIRDIDRSDFDYYLMCKWILLHAPTIFNKTDIGYLMERADFALSGRDTSYNALAFIYWHIGCARLDPQNAAKYLKDCIKIHQGEFKESYRAELYAELWHRCGLKEIDTVLDWFFGGYSLNERRKESTDNFIRHLEDSQDTVLLKRIIADDRFEHSIRSWDLVLLAWRYNLLVGKTLIPEVMTRSIGHPFGNDHEVQWDKAMKLYPKETQENVEKAANLKEELRKLL